MLDILVQVSRTTEYRNTMFQVSYLSGRNEFAFEVTCLNGMQFSYRWILPGIA